MAYNYRTLTAHIPKREGVQAQVGSLISVLQNVSTCVFDKYLDRLCSLEEHKVQAIFNAYIMTNLAIRTMEDDSRMISAGADLK